MNEKFTITLSVRDYECDISGIVNNAVYQHYLEHARHEYLKSLSIDFAELTQKNIHLVVTKATLTYRSPLRSGDEFIVSTNVERVSPTKFQFNQEIHHKTDNKLVLKGEIVGAALGEKGPILPNDLNALIPALAILDKK